jgi:serine/threonine protein kinase
LAALVQLSEGTVFAGDFRVVRPLSEGGMGAVYVVEQISTGKQRALKVMHPNLVHDQRQRQRFVQEAKIGARIESDHVVEVLGAGIDPTTETPWLVMELLQGETLEARLERTRVLSATELVEVFKQLCHALAAAHDAGIVHRDLKPENIFLAVPRREGLPFVVKILDFGIAKLVAESGNTTQAIGSPLWMAPEQTNADAAISPSTDVWALGLLAFTALTGHSYWRGAHAEAPNPMSIVMEVCFDPLDPASKRAAEYGATLPAGFDEWFAQCVSRDMGARFSNARAARGPLERLLSGLDGPPTRVVDVPVARANVPTMAAPELELPASKPKPEPPKPEPPKAPPPEKKEPPKPEPQPASRRSQPERIVIPPIKPQTAPRIVQETPYVPEKSFNWKPLAIGVVLVLGALFAAQKFLWTKAPATETPPPVASTEEPKTKPITKASNSAPLEKCPAGMARIPAGDLVPGDPTRAVESFCLDTHEVTVKSYAACVKSTKCTAAATTGNWTATGAEDKARNLACNYGRKDRDDHPINCVDWNQADAYCKANGKRLPSDVEWEWAARSGPVRYKYPWGFEAPDVQLCWSGFAKRTSTCPVGAYPKGSDSYGIHDLAGNVREWTSTIASGSPLHCGTDWTDKDEVFKLGYCGNGSKTSKYSFIGFRCAQ